MSSGAAAGVSVRRVAGAGGRSNQLVTLPDRDPASSEDILVFCGGDVQDLEAEMVKHRDNRRHVAWSLERTAQLLAQACPRSYVVVVRPARMERATFSCYDNFVACDSAGSPDTEQAGPGALAHLQQLLAAIQVGYLDFRNSNVDGLNISNSKIAGAIIQTSDFNGFQ